MVFDNGVISVVLKYYVFYVILHSVFFFGSIPGLATYSRSSFRFFKKGSCQLLAKVCARSTG